MTEKNLDEMSLQEWFAAQLDTPEAIAEGVAIDYIFEAEKRRHELGLSYAELARRMGVSRAYMSKLMSGTQNSTLGSLVKLALVLGCEVKLSLKPVRRKREASVAAAEPKPVAAKPKAARAVPPKARAAKTLTVPPPARKPAAADKFASPAKPAAKSAAKSRKASRV